MSLPAAAWSRLVRHLRRRRDVVEPSEESAATDLIWQSRIRLFHGQPKPDHDDSDAFRAIVDPRSGDHDDTPSTDSQYPLQTEPGSARAAPLSCEPDAAANEGSGSFTAWWLTEDKMALRSWARILELTAAATAEAVGSADEADLGLQWTANELARMAEEVDRRLRSTTWPAEKQPNWMTLSPEELQGTAWDAADTINHTLARLFVQLGPPPEAAGGAATPVTSDGGGAQQ